MRVCADGRRPLRIVRAVRVRILVFAQASESLVLCARRSRNDNAEAAAAAVAGGTGALSACGKTRARYLLVSRPGPVACAAGLVRKGSHHQA